MSIFATTELSEHALWPQGDIRDPLGVWVARGGVTGDATGGNIRVQIVVPAARRAGNIYTAYLANSVGTGVANDTATTLKIRLLTNWPDASPEAGIAGISSWKEVGVSTTVFANFPAFGPTGDLLTTEQRFILLFDPSHLFSGSDMPIMEIERNANVNTATYAFEAYGYYWDRSVLNAPGGPRHPGAS